MIYARAHWLEFVVYASVCHASVRERVCVSASSNIRMTLQ